VKLRPVAQIDLTIYRSINALAETTNRLYKAECVCGPDAPGWDDVDELEFARLSWVHWFNHDRLHGHCGDIPPAEFEAIWAKANKCAQAPGSLVQLRREEALTIIELARASKL